MCEKTLLENPERAQWFDLWLEKKEESQKPLLTVNIQKNKMEERHWEKEISMIDWLK